MRYLSVCSGIEAFSVAVEPLDWIAAAFAEIEAFPSRVLAHHWPDVPNLGDMTAIDVDTLGPVDWLVGGTPCQSFSVAGLRRGLKDARGNLTLAYVELAHALARKNGLKGALWENVPGCLSDKTNAFGCLLGGLVGHDDPLTTPDGERWPDVGMVAGPRARAAWRILNSQHFGVPQRRRRVFLVADFGDGADPAAVLFEPRGQGWSAEASGEAGQAIAATLSASTGGISQKDGHKHGQRFITHALKAEGADGSEDGTGRGVPMVVDTAPTLRAGGNLTGGHRPPGSDVDTIETLVAYLGNAEGGNAEAPSLNASNGKKGINNQTALVAVYDPAQVTNPDNRSNPSPELAHTLPAEESAPVLFSIRPSNSNKDYRADANDHAQSVISSTGQPPSARGGDVVVFKAGQGSKARGVAASKDTSPTLGAAESGSNRTPVIAFGAKGSGLDASDDLSPTLSAGSNPNSHPNGGAPPAIAFHGSQDPDVSGDVTHPLARNGGKEASFAQGMAVRRLTPRECERLQGFPDDEDPEELVAAGLEVRRTKKGKLRVNDPDGPRYKSLGNSFTVEVVNWIMCRVDADLRGAPMPDWQPMRLWGRKPRAGRAKRSD